MIALDEPVGVEAIKKLRIQYSRRFDGQEVDFDGQKVDFDGQKVDFDGQKVDFDGQEVGALADPPHAHRLSVAEARCPRSP